MTASDHLKHRTGSLGGDQDKLHGLFGRVQERARKCLNERIPSMEILPDIALMLCSALEEKTRECEDIHAMHVASRDAQAREIVRLRDQAEQLQRKVAEMSNAATSALSALAWLPEDKGPVRQRVQEVIAELRDALASRARTK